MSNEIIDGDNNCEHEFEHTGIEVCDYWDGIGIDAIRYEFACEIYTCRKCLGYFTLEVMNNE
tara:strand:+ start:388 stop:573 length:186 start_codon:yes stop_codon:yes gene_type:complete